MKTIYRSLCTNAYIDVVETIDFADFQSISDSHASILDLAVSVRKFVPSKVRKSVQNVNELASFLFYLMEI